MTEEEFRTMCEQHDLTYAYSDDHSVWRRGTDSLRRVREAAAQLGDEKAVPIWNSVVDQKLVPEARTQFYWMKEDA